MTNYDKLTEQIRKERKPFIVFDVETTGVMNGNDNRITQIALAKYEWNESRYELQDKIFMLAKGNDDVIRAIQDREKPTEDNARRILGEEFDYKSTHQKTFAYTDKEEYISKNLDSKIKEMENAPKIDEILSLQGIDSTNWLSSKDGLTSEEMAIGVMEFMNKYDNENVSLVTNGTYYAKHYLDKEGIVLDKDNEQTIDMVQAKRSWKGGGSEWTADVKDFAVEYEKENGKHIETFDALTKALIYGEMVGKATGYDISNRSVNYLANAVKESASKDEGYNLTQTELHNSLHIYSDMWDAWDVADYHFDSLEFVDFGNEKVYVDIDAMFEVNDNFEITLEGDKEPIKSWEELEDKIRSLNANISDKLLDQIKEKYEELEMSAENQRKEQLEIAYNDGTLDKDNLSGEDYEYLDSMYDLDKCKEKNDTTYDLEAKLSAMISDYDTQLEAFDAQLQIARNSVVDKLLPKLENIEKECSTLLSYKNKVTDTNYEYRIESTDYDGSLFVRLRGDTTLTMCDVGRIKDMSLSKFINELENGTTLQVKHHIPVAKVLIQEWDKAKESFISDIEQSLFERNQKVLDSVKEIEEMDL